MGRAELKQPEPLAAILQEGRHVKFLGHGCDPSKLGDVENVKRAIVGIVESCGMRILGLHPYDVEIELEKLKAEPFEDEGGVTVCGVLSTSHCAIHTWPARGFFVLDVYSCRTFESHGIRSVLRDSFARSRGDENGVRQWPHHEVDVRDHGGLLRRQRSIRSEADGMTLIETDLSFALLMPESWREPAPEFR